MSNKNLFSKNQKQKETLTHSLNPNTKEKFINKCLQTIPDLPVQKIVVNVVKFNGIKGLSMSKLLTSKIAKRFNIIIKIQVNLNLWLKRIIWLMMYFIREIQKVYFLDRLMMQFNKNRNQNQLSELLCNLIEKRIFGKILHFKILINNKTQTVKSTYLQ